MKTMTWNNCASDNLPRLDLRQNWSKLEANLRCPADEEDLVEPAELAELTALAELTKLAELPELVRTCRWRRPRRAPSWRKLLLPFQSDLFSFLPILKLHPEGNSSFPLQPYHFLIFLTLKPILLITLTCSSSRTISWMLTHLSIDFPSIWQSLVISLPEL